jgi:ABC-type uncharacterized transport system permease subunit
MINSILYSNYFSNSFSLFLVHFVMKKERKNYPNKTNNNLDSISLQTIFVSKNRAKTLILFVFVTLFLLL